MKKIIEIIPLHNGAHRNQFGQFENIPEGWAVIPDDMGIPETFPFVEIEAEEITHYREVMVEREVTKTREAPQYDGEGNAVLDGEGNPVMGKEEYTEQEWVTEKEPFGVMTVTSMTAGVMPEPVPEPEPVPTLEDRVTMLEDSNAEMSEALDMILSGVTE